MEQKSGGGGLGCLGVAQVVLIILKLTNLIDWSWGQVLIPVWIELGVLVILVVALFFAKNAGGK